MRDSDTLPFEDRDASAIADFYGRWATLYDRIATVPGIGRWRRRAADLVAEPGDVVVEMGCGSGANLPYLRTQVGPDGYVVGIDITRSLLEVASTRARQWDNVSVVAGDARVPPVQTADAVLATFVCGMFEDPAAVVNTWCDLVGPGGRVAVMDATASDDPLGRPLNPLFRAFTAASAPTSDVFDVLTAPCTDVDAPLTRRVRASRTALADRTELRTYEEFAAGFVGLLAGRVR